MNLTKNQDDKQKHENLKNARKKMNDKDKVTLVWKGNKIPCEDCKVIFKNKQGKEYNIELSRLIRVFNNNIWQHNKSVK